MPIATKLDPVRLTQLLFYLNAVVWILLAFATLLRISQGGSLEQTPVVTVIAVLMLGNAAAMFGSGLGLGKRYKEYFYFAIILLVINIILILTEEFGSVDALTMLLDLLLFGLLILSRNKYKPMPA